MTADALALALERCHPDAFEEALLAAFRTGLTHELVPILSKALLVSWHTCHEDLASALQDLRDPRAVAALFQAATRQHSYLDYDEFFGLARKCTWALADIGTPEARSRLEQLARDANPTIAGYAQKRLDNWDAELDRKAT